MLKMPTKTLLISAAVVLFAGCTTKQLPRPTAEKASVLTTLGAQRAVRGEGMKVWIFLLRKTRRYAVPRPVSSPKSGATDWAVKLSVFKGRVRGITMPTSINLPVSACMNE